MIKTQKGGKKGVKLMPNHYDYVSTSVRWLWQHRFQSIPYDQFSKVANRRALRA